MPGVVVCAESLGEATIGHTYL
eukprot:Gb_29293 [translate_table: standard]